MYFLGFAFLTKFFNVSWVYVTAPIFLRCEIGINGFDHIYLITASLSFIIAENNKSLKCEAPNMGIILEG